jgi:myosin heavy subunit
LPLFWASFTSKPTKKEIRSKQKNTEVEQLKAELEKDYYQALSDLEEMRGSNEELNALIEKQKEELTTQKTQIDKLLRDNRNLGSARAQMKDLNAKAQQYLAEINQLRQENEELIATNSQLSEVNQQLDSSLVQTREQADSLNAIKARLETQKAELQQTTEQLSKKVNIASVVKVNNLEATGLKVRGNGKTVTKKAADNIDQIQVCFNTTENDVAPVGTELFFVRIINPDGVTLAIETLGSGEFQNNASGQAVLYTRTAEIAYEKDVQQVCTVWAPGQAFDAGSYTVEVYNKGYLAGSTSFELR